MNIKENEKVLYHLVGFTELHRVFETIGESLPKEEDLPEGRVLDIGCFDGNTTCQISTLYPYHDILGIDVILENVYKSKNRKNILISDLEKNNSISKDKKKYLKERFLDIEFIESDGYKLNLNEKFSIIFFMNNLLFVLEGHSLESVPLDLFSLNSHLNDKGFILFSANKEVVILRKDKGKYFIFFNSLVSTNKIKAIEEILAGLNDII